MKKGLFVTVKGQRRVSKHVDCCVLQESNRTKVIKVGFDNKKNIFCNREILELEMGVGTEIDLQRSKMNCSSLSRVNIASPSMMILVCKGQTKSK